jgi:hypothetical protein
LQEKEASVRLGSRKRSKRNRGAEEDTDLAGTAFEVCHPAAYVVQVLLMSLVVKVYVYDSLQLS